MLRFTPVDSRHGRVPSTRSPTQEEDGDRQAHAQTLGHWFSLPCCKEMQMNAFFVLFCFVFFVFLKKNKELSEMLLEGNRVTEIKPGKDNIILHKKKKMQNSPQWLCLQVGHKSTHSQREGVCCSEARSSTRNTWPTSYCPTYFHSLKRKVPFKSVSK